MKRTMNLNIKSYLIFLAIMVLSTLTAASCSGASSFQKSIYNNDTNISNESDSYYFKDRIGGVKDNELDLTFSTFFGKQTIWKLTADQDSTINLELKTEITGGKFKVCLINENKQVSVISEGTNNQNSSLTIQEGSSFITIVGNNANGKIDMIVNSEKGIAIISPSN